MKFSGCKNSAASTLKAPPHNCQKLQLAPTTCSFNVGRAHFTPRRLPGHHCLPLLPSSSKLVTNPPQKWGLPQGRRAKAPSTGRPRQTHLKNWGSIYTLTLGIRANANCKTRQSNQVPEAGREEVRANRGALATAGIIKTTNWWHC